MRSQSHSTQWTVTGPREEPTTTPAPLEPLVEGGVVVCSDPTARDQARYDTEILDVDAPVFRDVVGGGFVLADFTGDGELDLIVAGDPAATFLGSNGSFVPDALGLDPTELAGMVGGSAADYDADGDLDLFVTREGSADRLFRNDGGSFSDVTTAAGVAGPGGLSVSASWDDFDGDGFVDLVVARYGPPRVGFYDPLEGDPSSLYRNRGDGTFEDVSGWLDPATLDSYGFMSGWYDLDGDADRELLLVNDFGHLLPSQMYRNDGGTLVSDESARFHPDYEGMAWAWAT